MASTAVEYAMTFLVGIVLLTGLASGLTTYVDDRDERVTEDHLEHVGAEISVLMTHHADLHTRDGEARDQINGLDGSVSGSYRSSTVVDEPPTVNGESYTVQVSPDGDELILSAAGVGVTTRVPINDVDTKPLSGGVGGKLVIVTDSSGTIRLESTELTP